jgi:hypothetical protein
MQNMVVGKKNKVIAWWRYVNITIDAINNGNW